MYDYSCDLNQQLTLIDSNSGTIMILISVYKNFQFLLDVEIQLHYSECNELRIIF